MIANQATFQANFETWFATIQGQLNGDIAGNLSNAINALGGSGRTTETVKKNADNIVALGESLASHSADYTKQVPYAVATGTANTYAITTPTITALTAGMAVSVKINIASTGVSTLNWDGKGAKTIKKANGTNVTNLASTGIYTLRYDGTNFILQGEGGSGDATASDLLLGKKASVDAGDIVGTMPIRGSEEFPAWRRALLADPIQESRVHLRIPLGAYLTPNSQASNEMGIFIDSADYASLNIRTGKNILGLAGTAPNITNNSGTPSGGYDGDYWVQP
ncbi:hypothetical protein [Clostridium sp. CF012]|uniref:hypothetical protein n=1 Tax=Clostridium sp. CF012 TaxID=2843319 RepID=UPI001C0D8D12|nr:hypothetical protein [Clostridium sp. CF012]MBU3146851.1 hypothetical protein [Clostridium sp. CF012]